MTYRILPIEEFGRELLASGDLDPVYIMLNRSPLDFRTKARWCLAYWCLYHCGAASLIAQKTGDEFWQWLNLAAHNKQHHPSWELPGRRWPRGKERRHWRGDNAINSFVDLGNKYRIEPANFVVNASARPLQELKIGVLGPFEGCRVPFDSVRTFVEGHVGFGPWMAFKVADMLEQCFDVPVDFSEAEVFMFKEPKEAALLFWRIRTGQPEGARPLDEAKVIREVVAYLCDLFKDHLAPNGKRPVGLQEVETILCKWKSHFKGHYPLYNDLDEISAALRAWSEISPLAKKLLESFPTFIRGRAD